MQAKNISSEMPGRIRSAIQREREGDISVYSNKNLLQLSDQTFDITHIRLSKRILIRLLQDSNSNIPTLQTLDVVSRFLGFYS